MVRSILAGYVLIFVAWTAAADVVVLKNGNRLEGEIVSQDDQSVTVRIGRAEMSVPRRDIDEIIEQDTPLQLYHKMLEGLDENDPKGHYQISLYCLKEALNDEAAALLRRALELKPEYPAALEKLKEVIAPASRELFERGKKLAAKGKPARAREKYARLVEDYPESDLAPEANAAIAESYFAQRNYLAAMAQWKEIIENDRHNTRAYLGAVRICEEVGEFAKAVEILDGVLTYETHQAIQEKCRNKKAIITQIIRAQEATRQAPDDPDNYARIGEQLEKLGQMRAAAKWMAKAVEKGSRDPAIVEKLARYCDKDLRVSRALQYWRLLKTLGPGRALAKEAVCIQVENNF